jgi:hypothetical protein
VTRELLKSQHTMFQYMKKRALSFEDSSQNDIRHYRKNFESYGRRNFATATMSSLNKKILENKLILLGDFHTFDHCVKNLVRVLHLLAKNNRNVVLGLEMLTTADQPLVDSFLSNHITELEFLESIHLRSLWMFPWTHYKTIFDFAKNNPKVIIRGVNTKGTLNERDKFCASTINSLRSQFPTSTLVVLYGEYHLAPNKLPSLIDKTISSLVIHQNLDSPFWSEARKRGAFINRDNVIKFNSNEFSIQTSSPWMKYESMCYWFESLYDDPDFNIHEYVMTRGLKTLSSSGEDTFAFFLKLIIKNLKLKIHFKNLSYTLYDHRKIAFLQKFILKTYTNKFIKTFLLDSLKTQHYLIIPNSGKIYFTSYSANKIAKIAGHFLYQETHPNLYYNLSKKGPLFCYLFLSSLNGYFMAKTVNIYLKTDLFLDHATKIKNGDNIQNRWISENVVHLFTKNTSIQKQVESLSLSKAMTYAKTLGELLAEYFFIRYQQEKKGFTIKTWHEKIYSAGTSFDEIQDVIEYAKDQSDFKKLQKRYY